MLLRNCSSRCVALSSGLLGLLLSAGVTANILVTGEDATSFAGAVAIYGSDGTYIGAFADPPSGPMDGPSAIRQGPDGNVYVLTGNGDPALSNPNTVYKYTKQGQFLSVFLTSDSTNHLGESKDMVFGPDGNLYISSNCAGGICLDGNGEILRFNGTTGAFMGVFVARNSGAASGCNRLSEAMALVFTRSGALLVGNDASSFVDCTSPTPGDRAYNILQFNGASGAYISAFAPAGSQRMYDPNGFVIGADNNLYVAEENLNNVTYPGPGRVLRYNGTTGAFIDEFVSAALNPALLEPEGIVFGPDGDLYVASGDGDRNGGRMVYKFNGSTGALISVIVADGITRNWQDPKGLLVLPDSALVPSPTLSQTAQYLLILALLGAFCLSWRKRQRRH